LEDVFRHDFNQVSVEDGEIGPIARLDRSTDVLFKRREGAVDRIGSESLLDRDLLLGEPAAGRLAFSVFRVTAA